MNQLPYLELKIELVKEIEQGHKRYINVKKMKNF